MKVPTLVWLFLMFFPIPFLHSEDCPCKIIESNNAKDTYYLEINGKRYIAASEDAWKEIAAMKSELGIAKSRIQDRDAYIALLEKPVENINEIFKTKNAYIKGLEEQVSLYGELADKYKTLKTDSWLKVELGGGFTGNCIPAAIGGVSIFNFYLLGFIQENNPGCFIGINIPIL